MDKYAIHPTKRELRQFLNNSIDLDKRRALEYHIHHCQFCSEYIENEKAFRQLANEGPVTDLLPSLEKLADGLFDNALSGLALNLIPLQSEPTPTVRLLAADGTTKPVPRVECLGTFFSESPELVLRVMRDNPHQRDYLQLAGEEPSLVSNVLVSLPDRGCDVYTDQTGRADLSEFSIDDYSSLKWEIRMPDAVFSLEPLTYDPEQTTHREEFLLSTATDSTIRVTFADKTEGKQISIEVLTLDGQSDFTIARVFVSQGEKLHPASVGPGNHVSFPLSDNKTRIDIRIFQ